MQGPGGESLVGCALYVMCDDLTATLEGLASRGVTHATPETADWGTSTSIPLPSGGRIGLYQPAHPTRVGL